MTNSKTTYFNEGSLPAIHAQEGGPRELAEMVIGAHVADGMGAGLAWDATNDKPLFTLCLHFGAARIEYAFSMKLKEAFYELMDCCEFSRNLRDELKPFLDVSIQRPDTDMARVGIEKPPATPTHEAPERKQ